MILISGIQGKKKNPSCTIPTQPKSVYYTQVFFNNGIFVNYFMSNPRLNQIQNFLIYNIDRRHRKPPGQ